MGMRHTVAALVLTASVFSASQAQALLVDLGTAGPDRWALLALGGIGAANKTDINITGPSGVTTGVTDARGVGIADVGNLSLTGSSSIDGTVFLNSGGTATTTGSSSISGGVVQNSATDILLNQAVADALSASSAAAALTATDPTITEIDKDTGTIVGGPGQTVLNVNDVSLSEGAVTLSAPAGGMFVINVSGKLKLSGGADILLAGGITFEDVLFNVIGPGQDVAFSGGTEGDVPKSVFTGILLAPERKVSLSPGLIVGELIAGGATINITSGGQIDLPPTITQIAEPAAATLFLSGLLVLGVAVRRRSAPGSVLRPT